MGTESRHDAIREEELSEEQRHDQLYADELKSRGQQQPMAAWEWEKFDHLAPNRSAYLTSVAWLGDVEGRRVLDAGCGTGWLSVILAKRGAERVDGFDISSTAVQAAEECARVNDCASVCRFRQGSCYDIPFDEEDYDLVAGQALLHHLRDKSAFKDELVRVLRPGGVAVFYEPYGESQLFERIRQALPFRSQADDPDHWKDKIKLSELDLFRADFAVEVKMFELLNGFSRYFPALQRPLEAFDSGVLRALPFLRRYSRGIVIKMTKRSSGKVSA